MVLAWGFGAFWRSQQFEVKWLQQPPHSIHSIRLPLVRFSRAAQSCPADLDVLMGLHRCVVPLARARTLADQGEIHQQQPRSRQKSSAGHPNAEAKQV